MSWETLFASDNPTLALAPINAEIAMNGASPRLAAAKALVLMHMGKFSLALTTIKRTRQLVLPFETAYCLYRLGKFTAAIAACDAMDDSSAMDANDTYGIHGIHGTHGTVSTPHAHNSRTAVLRAQILYRLERFEEAARLYDTLVARYPEDGAMRTNWLAAKALARQPVPDAKSDVSDGLFDDSYNRAIGAAMLAQHAAVRSLAHTAKTLAQDQSQMANVELVRIYALIASGSASKAVPLLVQLASSSELAPVQRALVDANLAACGQPVSCKLPVQPGLFEFQLRQLAINCRLPSRSKAHPSKQSTVNVEQAKVDRFIARISSSARSAQPVRASKNPTAAKPAAKLDSERWIPLKDRSYYKKTLKKQPAKKQ